MTSPSCPICRMQSPLHKLDCQNASYVDALDKEITRQIQRLEQLQAEYDKQAKSFSDLMEKHFTLKADSRTLHEEYKKTWEVLRTYNPVDIELEYIGFKTIETGEIDV